MSGGNLFFQQERARWDLNPRSPAPKADTLIRARLRAHLQHNKISVPIKKLTKILINQPDINLDIRRNCGLVAQLGWSVRLIIERSPVQIRLGPPPKSY